MKPLAALVFALLAGCASTPAPVGTQASSRQLLQSVIPGRTTKAELLATFGATKSVVFDSGYEAWLYQSPAGAGRFSEFVVLLGPDGVVRKARQRAPSPP